MFLLSSFKYFHMRTIWCSFPTHLLLPKNRGTTNAYLLSCVLFEIWSCHFTQIDKNCPLNEHCLIYWLLHKKPPQTFMAYNNYFIVSHGSFPLAWCFSCNSSCSGGCSSVGMGVSGLGASPRSFPPHMVSQFSEPVPMTTLSNSTSWTSGMATQSFWKEAEAARPPFFFFNIF